MSPLGRLLMAALLAFVVVSGTGCTGRLPPVSAQSSPRKVSTTPAAHVVQRGETLYAISVRYGIDYRQLARWNKIAAPFTIYPGQKLVLRTPSAVAGRTAGATSARPAASTTKRPASRQPVTSPPLARQSMASKPETRPVGSVTASTPVRPGERPKAKAKDVSSGKNVEQVTESLNWSWPTKGRVVVKFDPADPTKNGIDIEGEALQEIRVAEAGQVVYSGSGLVGYGNLVIVKHNEIFLTAYGYNSEVLVKEGDELKAGAVIAKMGRGLNRRPALHFEVRREGKPVNPLLYLPRRN